MNYLNRSEYRDKAMYNIYILRCPLTKEPRYVGATRMTLKERLTGHLSDVLNGKKWAWIQSLQKKKEFPIIELQYKIKGYWEARKKEKEMIVTLSKKYSLFNIMGNPAAKVDRIPSKYIIDTLPK